VGVGGRGGSARPFINGAPTRTERSARKRIISTDGSEHGKPVI
jgi:hypothetical protein